MNPGEVVPATNTQLIKGDVNQDGSVSVADISALMAALTDVSDYENGSLQFGGSFVRANHTTPIFFPDVQDVADIDGNGLVNNLDIQAEINLVAGLLPPGPGLPVGGKRTRRYNGGSGAGFIRAVGIGSARTWIGLASAAKESSCGSVMLLR